VWGRMVRIPKVPCTKMIMAMLTLSCYKIKNHIYKRNYDDKKRKKEGKYLYIENKREKNKRRERRRILLF
jgi:hypothetical protein